jgi:hypothetical protein
VGILDTLLGRTKPAKPDLDALFALPSAAVTLQAGAGLSPTGLGAVCLKPAEGGGFVGLREQIHQLLDVDDDRYEETTDAFGFTWLTRRGDPGDLSDLVGDLHSVNSSLAEAGFGAALLCTLVTFTDGRGTPVGWVYLYKRGTWYPFAPTGPQQRDNARELQLQAVVGADLKLEPDLSRWFPVWGAPGL